MTRTLLLILGALATLGFATIVLVVLPQVILTEVPTPAEYVRHTPVQQRGRELYVENGCVYCHSQQVRDVAFTTDVARGWGPRPTVPADYVFDEPHLLGTMRTGPDLMNVGDRLPDLDWHLIHLYDPRALVEWSIMPAFPYLFDVKDSTELRFDDYVVPVQGPLAPQGRFVVATRDAIALVRYLQALRLRPLPVDSAADPAAATGTAARGVHTMP